MDNSNKESAKDWLINEYNDYVINFDNNQYKCKFCMTFKTEYYLLIVQHIHYKHFRDSLLIRFPKYRNIINNNNKVNENNKTINKSIDCLNYDNNHTFNSEQTLSQTVDKSVDFVVKENLNTTEDNYASIESKSDDNVIKETFVDINQLSDNKSQTIKTDIVRAQINAYFNKVSKSERKIAPKIKQTINKRNKKQIKNNANKQTVNRIGYIKRIVRLNQFFYQCCWPSCQYESEVMDNNLLDHIKRHQKSDSNQFSIVKDSVSSVKKPKLDLSDDVKVVKLVIRKDSINSIIFND